MIAFYFVRIAREALAVGFGFAAGAMIYLVVTEFLPEALEEGDGLPRGGRPELVTGVLLGVALMIPLTFVYRSEAMTRKHESESTGAISSQYREKIEGEEETSRETVQGRTRGGTPRCVDQRGNLGVRPIEPTPKTPGSGGALRGRGRADRRSGTRRVAVLRTVFAGSAYVGVFARAIPVHSLIPSAPVTHNAL